MYLGASVVAIAEGALMSGRADHAFVSIVAEFGVVVMNFEG
jgi:hypothetical protein